MKWCDIREVPNFLESKVYVGVDTKGGLHLIKRFFSCWKELIYTEGGPVWVLMSNEVIKYKRATQTEVEKIKVSMRQSSVKD